MRTWTVLLILLAMALPAAAQLDPVTEGNQLLRLRQYQGAVAAFDRALQADGENVTALTGRAEAYVQLGEFQAALDDTATALGVDSENADAYLWQGLANLGLENYDEAAESIEQSVALEPDPTNFVYLAQAYAIAGDVEQAVDSYTEAVAAAPQEEQAAYIYTRGQFQSQIGDLEAAIADYTEAIELEPENADYYFSRSFAYFDLGDIERAIEDDTRVIELQPDFPSAYLNRGFHYYSDRNYEPASADYIAWIDLLDGERFDLDPLEDGEDELDLDFATGTVYYLPFQAPQAGVIDVQAYSRRGGVDPVVVILDADGQPFMVDDDGGFGLSAELDGYNLPGAGDYTLVIGHAGGGSQGEVTVEIEVRRDFGDV